MTKKVLKFGGSSLADAQQFRKAADIILADPDCCFAVASAPGKRFDGDNKVTDLLYRCHDLSAQGGDALACFAEIEERYNGIIAGLGLDFSLEEDFRAIRDALQNRPGRDYLASRGEYLNSKIMAKLLGFSFLDAAEGIFFRADGRFDDRRTYPALAELLADTGRTVVPGFYGSLPDGTVKTFSRGGSDITGAIVARAAEADVYENWTDVSGMLMADPRIVKNPRVIKEITYGELRELAYMGATVMHDEAIFPVREASIPINIRNTNAPADPGTWIVSVSLRPVTDTVITGVAGHKGFSSVTVEKDRMNAEVGFGRKILSALEDFDISFEHIPSGIDTMSVVVSTEHLAPHKNDLVSRIFRDTAADAVHIEEGLALIAVVGRGMVRAKGTAGRIFTAVSARDINIRMIDQGSSENNIIIGVEEASAADAIDAIYREFVREEV